MHRNHYWQQQHFFLIFLPSLCLRRAVSTKVICRYILLSLYSARMSMNGRRLFTLTLRPLFRFTNLCILSCLLRLQKGYNGRNSIGCSLRSTTSCKQLLVQLFSLFKIFLVGEVWGRGLAPPQNIFYFILNQFKHVYFVNYFFKRNNHGSLHGFRVNINDRVISILMAPTDRHCVSISVAFYQTSDDFYNVNK